MFSYGAFYENRPRLGETVLGFLNRDTLARTLEIKISTISWTLFRMLGEINVTCFMVK